MPHTNPVQIQQFLKGVNYPARKEGLIENARNMGADQDVCASLEQLPDTFFETPADVSQALSGSLKEAPGGLAEFLTQAIQESQAEVELCELALQKSSNDDVKMFAQHMIEEHSYMGNEIERVAAGKKIVLPKDVASENRSILQEMEKLSGTEFDLEFMNYNVMEHEKDAKVFQYYAEQETDADIRDMVKNSAGVLNQHLKMAKGIAGKLRPGA